MFKKMFTVLVATAILSGSAMALDFNPMIGVQVQAEDDKIGAENALVIGGELIMQNNILFGGSYSANDRDDLAGYGSKVWSQANIENQTLSLWVGKVFDSNISGKVGLTHYESEMTVYNPYYGWETVSGSQTHLMLGAGYYFKSGFNLNAHLNIPVSGDRYMNTSLSDYTNMQLLAGYRF